MREENLVTVHNRKLTRREGKNEYVFHVRDKFCVMFTTRPGEIQVKRYLRSGPCSCCTHSESKSVNAAVCDKKSS